MKEQKHEQWEKKARLLESELQSIKGSRSYKLVKSAAVVRNRIKSDPKGSLKKITGKVLSDPKFFVRVLRGGSPHSAIEQTVQNLQGRYHEWIMMNEPGEAELNEQRRLSQDFKYKPLISIVTPVFNPPTDVLKGLLESVVEQTYPHFELCLGDFGDSEEVRTLLAEYAAADSRIKVETFTDNKGIAYNSNQILERMVKGEYIALLDHDDTISGDALYENVKLLNEQKYDFIYSDKDMIDEQDNRFGPLFKPDWSPEIMLSANYLTHLNVMSTAIVKKVGAWDSETDGAQDWDLFLKIVSATDKIAHIPKVLYHWRVIATSTAMSIETKPYALAGQRKAVQKYLDAKRIKAKPFHDKTELLLDWDKSVFDTAPIVVIRSDSVTDTLRFIRRLKIAAGKLGSRPRYVALHTYDLQKNEQKLLAEAGTVTVKYEAGGLGKTLHGLEMLRQDEEHDVLVVRDDLHMPRDDWFTHLTGWLSVGGVGCVGGKILQKEQLIVDAGAVVTDAPALVPLFKGYPSYYNGYIGNTEWVRNLSIVTRDLFATKTSVIRTAGFDASLPDDAVLQAFFLDVQKHDLRLVFNPKVLAYPRRALGEEPTDADALRPRIEALLKRNPHGADRYSNPNLHQLDPMRLSSDMLDTGAPATDEINSYQHDAIILARMFDISHDEMVANEAAIKRHAGPIEARSVAWFLPGYGAVYAGLHNIFGFADHLQREHGLKTTFYILKGGDAAEEQRLAAEHFPSMAQATFAAISHEDAARLPAHDISICTQWATAYTLAKYNDTKRKCYFIQDNEPNFYPKGSTSAQVALTYRFGFTAIANTDGLMDMYAKEYKGEGVVLKSLVDLAKYTPRENRLFTTAPPYKVFFYARPNMPRNAFELGIAGLLELKRQLGDGVQIYCAGANWDEAEYGVAPGQIINLRKIPYDEVPAFYRSLDAGLMFMFSGHPGVTASELMASGTPVVVNEYDDKTWHDLYKHGKTAMITMPTASEVARNLRRCLEDQPLRAKLIEGGLEKVREFYYDEAAYHKTAAEALKRITGK